MRRARPCEAQSVLFSLPYLTATSLNVHLVKIPDSVLDRGKDVVQRPAIPAATITAFRMGLWCHFDLYASDFCTSSSVRRLPV